MQIRRVRVDESELDRYVGECWFPYHEDLGETVVGHSLAGDVDRGDVVDHHLDVLDSPSARLWVALEGADDPMASLSAVDATFAGFVRTGLEPTLPTFDWPPDRIRIHDLWVAEPYRGSGVADELVARARRQARENGTERLTITVGSDNGRALAYVKRLGFETQGFGMHVALEDLDLDDGERAPGERPSSQLRRVRADDAAAVRRFVEEAWAPFWRAIEAADGIQRLSSDWNRDAVVGEFREALDDADRRVWVALDDVADRTDGLADADGVVAGWLGAGLAHTDRFLDPPERLEIARLYADPEYRGTGLADHLMERAMQYAREEGCAEFVLDVGTGNERARAYYGKLGFEPYERRLSVGVDDVAL